MRDHVAQVTHDDAVMMASPANTINSDCSCVEWRVMYDV
jgi:hypothetical protein